MPCSRLENEEEEAGDPRTIDVVGNTEFSGALISDDDEYSALLLYPYVLGHTLLLVKGISLRKNPCEGSSNLMSKASHRRPIIKKYEDFYSYFI